jgi:uncharacterized protein YbjT (DUF2867 family)
MTRIAVAGATGRVGRHVVDVLHEGGHDVVTISRANGVDVITGEGPGRILRAAQFHEFVEVLMSWGRQGDVIYLPTMRTQIVAARTVAEALVDMALSQQPEGTQPAEIAGPREEYLPDLAQLVAARRDEQVKIEAVSNPADPDDALNADGGLLPGPHATLAGPTFAEWLEAN